MLTHGSSSDVSNFKYDKPKKAYNELFKLFGKPSHVLNKEGGSVIWDKETLNKAKVFIFSYIVLKDEEIPHSYPEKHYDYLYTYVPIYISDEVLPEILSLSKSITYDKLKQLLMIRSDSIGANIIMTWLILNILTGKLNTKDVISLQMEKYLSNYIKKHFELLGKYEDEIFQKMTFINSYAPSNE